MSDALVLSAGGLWAAWEVGAWEVLRARFRPELIVGASAGSWNGWAIAGGATSEQLAQQWLEPQTGKVMQFGLHPRGFLLGAPLEEAAKEMFARYKPQIPFALTMVEVPSMRSVLVRDKDITWQHLAASCSIPLGFPPVKIGNRQYVDGGFRAALPLWAAEELGAHHALALNVLNTPIFRLAQRTFMRKRASAALKVTLLEPSQPLGSLRDAIVWKPENIQRWIEQGRRDASSITM